MKVVVQVEKNVAKMTCGAHKHKVEYQDEFMNKDVFIWHIIGSAWAMQATDMVMLVVDGSYHKTLELDLSDDEDLLFSKISEIIGVKKGNICLL